MDRAVRIAARKRGAASRAVKTQDLVLGDVSSSSEASQSGPGTPKVIQAGLPSSEAEFGSSRDSIASRIQSTPRKASQDVSYRQEEPKPSPRVQKHVRRTANRRRISIAKTPQRTPKSRVSSSQKSRKSLTNSLQMAKRLMKKRSELSPLQRISIPKNYIDDTVDLSDTSDEYHAEAELDSLDNEKRRNKAHLQKASKKVHQKRLGNMKKRAPKRTKDPSHVKSNTNLKSFNIMVQRLMKDLGNTTTAFGSSARSVKINALDIVSNTVLEHFESYEETMSEPQYSNTTDKKLLAKYKSLVLDSFMKILDLNLLINSLTANLKTVAAKKLGLRQKIFYLRQVNSKDISHSLEVLRYKNVNLQRNNIKITELDHQLKKIKNSFANKTASQSTQEKSNTQLLNEIHVKLSNVGNVVNPHWGILEKLKSLNHQLTNIDPK